MSAAPVRAHLADAAGWNVQTGKRRRFALALAVVTAAHLALVLRPGESSSPPRPPQADPPGVSLQLTAPFTLAVAAPAEPQPSAAPAPQLSQPTPTLTLAAAGSTPPVPPPLPDPSAVSPPPTPALLAPTSLSPVDPTAQPIQFTAAPAAPSGADVATRNLVASSSGPACDLTPALQAALQGDQQVRDDLARIPRQARSVAEAVQFWDGAWIDPAAIGGAAIADPIRAAIVAVVNQQPPACHDQLIQGPRLFPISDPRGTVIVAVGSGVWKWSDLADESSAPLNP